MQTLRLSTLDLAIVAAYLVTVTVVGLWASRGVRSGREFFLAGRSLPWWAAGMSLVVSDIGAKDMIGLAGDAYRYGIVMMNFDFIGCTLPVLFAAFVFMPFFWLAGVYTVPEYLGRRYCPLLRTLFALIWAAFMVGTLGTIFVSAASMFEGLVGWSFWWSVGFTAIVAGLYAAAGGLKAVVATEVVSCLVLATGAALLCVLGVARVGGFGSLATAVAGYS